MSFLYDGFAINSNNDNYDDDDDDGDDDDDANEEEFLPWTSNTSQPNELMDYPKSPPIESDNNAQFTFGAEEFQAEGGEEIPLPKMPEEFYNGVEIFLSRSPPKLKSKKRLEIEGANSITGLTKHASAHVLPRSNITAKCKQMQVPSRRNIDLSLVSEAFAFTDKILRDAVLEEAQEAAIGNQGQSHGRRDMQSKSTKNKPHSAGSVLEKSSQAYLGGNNSASQQARKPKSAKDRLGAGMVKRLRQTANSSSNTSPSGRAASTVAGAFSVSVVSEDDSSNRKIVDFDAMVANLSQGLTMRKLQAELAASQLSMQRSSAQIRDLAGQAGLR